MKNERVLPRRKEFYEWVQVNMVDPDVIGEPNSREEFSAYCVWSTFQSKSPGTFIEIGCPTKSFYDIFKNTKENEYLNFKIKRNNNHWWNQRENFAYYGYGHGTSFDFWIPKKQSLNSEFKDYPTTLSETDEAYNEAIEDVIKHHRLDYDKDGVSGGVSYHLDIASLRKLKR